MITATFELLASSSSKRTGPGNVILIKESYQHVTEIATGFGEKCVSAEQIAQDTVEALGRRQTSAAVVGDYLADQRSGTNA